MTISNLTSVSRNITRKIDKTKKYLAKKAVILGKMDGWDELAVAAANILPAYARPAFLTAALGILSVPVSCGAGHMAAEFQEMKDEAQGLKNKQVNLALRLLASGVTKKDISEKFDDEFKNNNANNQRILEGLNTLNENLNKKIKDKDTNVERNKTPAEQASDIKKAFQKLDIKYDDSDDLIEGLLKKDDNKKTEYDTVKKARDFIQEYKEANKEEKTALTQEIEKFVTDNKGILEINDTDWNWTKDKKITEALQAVADNILEPERNAYTIKLSMDYYTELHNKQKLKEALDKGDDTKDLLNTLNIIPYTQQQRQSTIIQYQNNKREIQVEQTPVTGYLGNLAMTGMTVGTALSATKSGTQLLGQFGVLPNLIPTLTAGLEFASSGVFIASQASMIAYGLGEAHKGIQKNKLLEKNKDLLISSFALKDNKELTQTQSEQLAHIEQLKHYNTQKNTLYGVGIAAAEAGMIAGSLTGSSPLLMASALGTLAFAGLRMVTQSAEANLTGDAHDHDHKGKPLIMLNIWKKPEVGLPQDTPKTGHIHTTSCKHDNSQKDFELNSGKLNRNDTNNIDALYKATKELAYLTHSFINNTVDEVKSLFIRLIPHEEKGYEVEMEAIITNNTFLIGVKIDEKKSDKTNLPNNIVKKRKVWIDYDPKVIYINSILANPTALENTKEILIDSFEDKGGDDHKKDLETLKSKRPDIEALIKLFTDNLAELDKPQNAKKILKPLLQERIEKLKDKKHNLIQNMVHLQEIKERESVRIINQEMPLGVLD